MRAVWKDPSPLPSSTESEEVSKSPPMAATARSGIPSPLKSPTAAERGREPVAKFRAAWKVPSPLPSSTETLLEVRLTTARSGTPSPLKSPTAAETGGAPGAKLRAAWKGPPPLPRSSEMVPDPPLTTARSRTRSPLKSPTTTKTGFLPTAKVRGAWKVRSAPPSSTETVSERELATARSGTPSPLKSPTATDEGSRPPDAKSLRPTNDTVSASAGAGSVDQQINVAATSRKGLAEFLIISSPPRARGSLSVASLLGPHWLRNREGNSGGWWNRTRGNP